jgi:hypothetical protein
LLFEPNKDISFVVPSQGVAIASAEYPRLIQVKEEIGQLVMTRAKRDGQAPNGTTIEDRKDAETS